MDAAESNKTHYVRCLKCGKILECSRYDTSALLEHIRTDHPEIDIVDKEMPRKAKKQTPEASKPEMSPPKKDKSSEQSRTYTQEMFDKTPDQSRTLTQSMCDKADKSDKSGKSAEKSEEKSAEKLLGFKTFHPKSSSSPGSSRVRSQKGFLKLPGVNKGDLSECGNVIERSSDSGGYTRRYQVHSPPCIENSRSLYRTSIEKWRPANGTIYCPRCGANQRPLIRTQAQRTSSNSCCAACILGCWPFCFLPFLVPSDSKEYLHCSNCKYFLGLYDRCNNCVKPNREFVQQDNETPVRATASNESKNCTPAESSQSIKGLPNAESTKTEKPSQNEKLASKNEANQIVKPPPIIESSQNLKLQKQQCCV